MFYSIKKHNISLATNEKLHVFSEHQIGHPTLQGAKHNNITYPRRRFTLTWAKINWACSPSTS